MYPEVLFILQKKSGNEMRLKKYEHLIHIHLFKICKKIITIQIILSLTSIHWHHHHSLLMITGKNHWFFCHYFHLFISYPFVKTSIKYLFWKVFYVKTFVKVLDSSLFTSFFVYIKYRICGFLFVPNSYCSPKFSFNIFNIIICHQWIEKVLNK